jgi:hypothetical protein
MLADAKQEWLMLANLKSRAQFSCKDELSLSSSIGIWPTANLAQ